MALQSKPKVGRVATSECSTSSAYWIADTVGVAAGVAALAYSIAKSGDSDTTNTIGGVGAFGGVLYLASAGNGYKWARQCRESQEIAPIALR